MLIFAFVLSNVSCAREIHSFESAQVMQITESYIEETVVETEPPLSEDEIIDQRVEEILSQMTLEDKICQMLVVSFRDGDQLNENMAQSLTGNHYGGVILFDENLTDVRQTIRYISVRIRRAVLSPVCPTERRASAIWLLPQQKIRRMPGPWA